MYKKIVSLALVLVLCSYTPLGLQGSESRATISSNGRNTVITRFRVPWDFYTYTEASFTSQVLGLHKPQTVSIFEVTDDGWGRVIVDSISCWMYIRGNRFYIDKPTPLVNNKGDVYAVSAIAPQVVSVVRREGNWVLINSWMGQKWLNTDAIRPEVLIDVPALNQRDLGLPTGCELVALAMVISYELGREVDINTLVGKLPRSYDPNEGFRGDPSTTNGFTVLPSGIIGLADEYLDTAINMTGSDMHDLKAQLNMDRPIVAWVVGMGFYVHAICLTGYNESGFFYNNPWSGSKNSFISYDDFYAIWNTPIHDRALNIYYPERGAISY